MSLVISQLQSDFGSYYKAGGQGIKDLRTAFFTPNNTSKVLFQQITNDTQLQGGLVAQSAVLQAYQDTFTPYGDTTLSGKKIDLTELKVDISFNPTKLMNSWAGFLTNNSLDRTTYPLSRYMIEQLILPKMQEDYELNGIFKGVKGSVTPGTALAIGSAINGLNKVRKVGIAASTITPIALGAVPTDAVDFVTYVEAFLESIPEIVRPYIRTVQMAPELHTRYKKGMVQKYNMNYAMADINKSLIYPSIEMVGCLSHAGSTVIWASPFGNVVEATKAPENETFFRLETEKRNVHIFTDYWKAVGIWQEEYFYTNDVETS